MARVKIFFRWVGIGLAGLVVLLVLCHTVLNIYTSKKLKNEINKIKEKGEPLTFQDLIQGSIPEEENAATIYNKVFSLLEAYKDELDKVQDAKSYTDISKWTNEEKKDIPAILEKHNEIFDLLHEAALKDKCNFNLDYSKGPAMPLPHLAKLRACSRLLVIRATLDMEKGDTDKASERITDGFAAARASRNDHTFISNLVRIACDAIMLSSLEELLEEKNISHHLCRKLYNIVNEERQSELIDFFGERLFGMSCWDMMFRRDRSMLKNLYSTASLLKEKMRWWYASSILHRPFFKLYYVSYLRIMAKGIEAAKQPYWEVKDEDIFSIKEIPRICFFTRMLVPALGRAMNQEARSDAQLGVAEIALALRMYKIKKGNYPTDLTELVPESARELPKDPFTGKNFIYKRKGEGFVVYSLGDNCKDDGGKWGEKSKYEDGDIVFEMAR